MKKFGMWLKAIFGKCIYAADRAYETQLEQRQQRGQDLSPLPPMPPPPQYDLPSLSDIDSDDDVDWTDIQGDDEYVLIFLLFFSFWCFMPKGEKIRGVNNFSQQLRFMSYSMSVSLRQVKSLRVAQNSKL